MEETSAKLLFDSRMVGRGGSGICYVRLEPVFRESLMLALGAGD